MGKYILMHKNIPCGEAELDPLSGNVEGYKDYQTGWSPFLGNFDIQKFKLWWKTRTIPASRSRMMRLAQGAGDLTAEGYLIRNLALSMTDSYWICPEGMSLKYDDISFHQRKHDTKIPVHQVSTYDPNASLGGQMSKYWDLTNGAQLVKESFADYGLQAINEVFATTLHQMQKTDVPFVEYSLEKYKNGFLCRCPAFTDEKREFITAYEVLDSRKKSNQQNNYAAYIENVTENGISEDVIHQFMDYQTMTDFIISNVDEHLFNFGVLRDSDSGELIAPAPIFDSGNSMFFNEDRMAPYSRVALLEQPIASFYTNYDKMLQNIKNTNVVRLDLLPEPGFVKDFYADKGLPEKEATVISTNYATKLHMVDELQHGIKISLYHEKQKNRSL